MGQRDLDFISGRFIDLEIPREKQYLLKYFSSELQVAFLRYFMCFESVYLFCEHTGHHCSDRMLWKLKKKYHRLVDTYTQAKASLSEEGMETVLLIEKGGFRP